MQTTTLLPTHSAERSTRVLTRSLGLDFESATERVLTQGGDTRIELNAAGLNGYGCAPRPDPELLQFGSSTGSVISAAGFQAAVALYRRLYSGAGSYHFEVERQRQQLRLLSGAGRLPGTEVVLAASGTDIHLFAAHLAAQGKSQSLQAVMVEPSETGSGVPAALAALHFATQTSQGRSVRRGAPLASMPRQRPAFVKLRHGDGSLRSVAEVDAEFSLQVEALIQAGERCLLVLTDLSKTGLLAPSLACAQQLQQLHGEQLAVLVDACQFRLSAGTLCAYLAQDFMVAITGSKFVGGPAFCGALLLPPGVAQRSRQVPLAVLQDYSCRSDWPDGWLPAKALAATANLGLLLRWEAALTELRQFTSIPDRDVHAFLQKWQRAVSQRIALDDNFDALPVAQLQRGASTGLASWDSVQTIFPFQVYKWTGSDGRQALSLNETALLYRRMRDAEGVDQYSFHLARAAGQRFQLGQPVPCGQRDARPVSALRMCSSARLVTESMAGRQSVAQFITQTMLAFDKLARLAQAFC